MLLFTIIWSKISFVYSPQSGLEILEALAATGLRAIRYALEVPGVKQIYANDISKTAVDIMNKNIEENNVQNLVTSTRYDAA